MSLAQNAAEYLSWLETELRSLLAAPDETLRPYYGILQYHMGWVDADLQPVNEPAGKRIRPLLCLLSCAAAGGDPRRAVPAAAGIELLHNFSLIHDDIEDRSDTRRHRLATWVVFGLAQACNAGDAMFGLTYQAFDRLSDRGVPAATVLRVVKVLNQTCAALTQGQYLDISFEQRLDVTLPEYDRMVAGKTAALLGAAPEIGAILAGAAPEVVSVLRQYGENLGMAFQWQDDILGIWGDEVLTGKSAASDILSKKKSLPVVYALGHAQAGTELRALYAGPDFVVDNVPAVLTLLNAAGARAFAEARVSEAVQAANDAVATLAAHCATPAVQDLRELLDSLVGRQS